jgi:hypothetical protein
MVTATRRGRFGTGFNCGRRGRGEVGFSASVEMTIFGWLGDEEQRQKQRRNAGVSPLRDGRYNCGTGFDCGRRLRLFSRWVKFQKQLMLFRRARSVYISPQTGRQRSVQRDPAQVHFETFIFSPALLGMISVFAAIVWMLLDQEDKMRPFVVFAIIINLFYGTVLTIFLGGEGSLLPWKYDLILFEIDRALGFTAAAIALPLLHGIWRMPLLVVYESLLPVMILCCFLQRRVELRNLILRGYMVELVIGPIFYAILPACGPVYAFGPAWLHPLLMEPAQTIRLTGFPNAFPSLHVATAFLLRAVCPPGLLARSGVGIFDWNHAVDALDGRALRRRFDRWFGLWMFCRSRSCPQLAACDGVSPHDWSVVGQHPVQV